MFMKKRVKLYFNSTLLHFTQLITGLELLKKKGEIDLVYKLDLNKYPSDIFKLEYNNKVVFFDMADNSAIRNNFYDECDFYVKRMLLKEDFEIKKKLIPYGINYQVYYKNRFLKFLFLKDVNLLKYSLRFSRLGSGILNIKDGISNNRLSKMQSSPSQGNQILFRSRLWDPEKNDVKWKKEERNLINKERIEINNLLKSTYGNSFFGGIQKSEFSAKLGKDFLLSEKEYHKKHYLKVLKQSSIGVLNPGLEESISWKFGEYISHSLAIVSSPIEKFHLLGPLIEGEHYLKFESPEECLEKTDILFRHDEMRKKMQLANWHYYQNWLHPERKIAKIFNLIEEYLP